MNKIKTKNILIVLCVLVVVLIIVVLYTKTNKPEAQEQTIKPLMSTPGDSITKQTTQDITSVSNIDLQAKCAAQAEKVVTSYAEKVNTQLVEFGGHNINFYQQNHYNQNLNKCFVLISDDSTPSNILFDAYENKRLATCSPQDNFNDNMSWLGTKIINGMTYISQKECNDFVNTKMELN
ncbi:MAG: hypothetical protein KGI58_03115 [Patescibacteria group bacterium]|nr:hypothetical protein [Patescibacteria group bacterium]